MAALTSQPDIAGVHVTHCCSLHGCKYGKDKNCPVASGERKQKYLCESCTPAEELEKQIARLQKKLDFVRSISS